MSPISKIESIIRSFQTSLNLSSKRCFYDARTRNDTIFAPLTDIRPVKGSPLGVIRISGTKTSHVLQELTCRRPISPTEAQPPKDHKLFRVLKPREATLTKIVAPNTRDLIDLALVLWFPKPNSYTGEDSCELHLHGSRAIMTNVLEVLGAWPGIRPAEPGEFTRRAVLNGKMSLIQAESLPDIISSQTDIQRKLALSGLDGSTKAKYESWKDELINILAYLEASIDFGEDELLGEQAVVNDCIERLKRLKLAVGQLIDSSSRSRQMIQSGIKVAILGKPNAGKSTFMNLLCCSDKSIVSDLSGTTRDVVEHSFEFASHAISLCDTAGLKDMSLLGVNNKNESTLEKHNNIEREGIVRALEAARKADVIIYLVDGCELTDNDEKNLLNICRELRTTMQSLGEDQRVGQVHLVVNKIDKNRRLANSDIDRKLTLALRSNGFDKVSATCISCVTQENVDQLTGKLTKGFDELTSGACDATGSEIGVRFHYVNERHLSLLKSVQRHLEQASGMSLSSVDEMAQHVRESVDYFSRIVGSISNEQVFDVIFRDFCIGK